MSEFLAGVGVAALVLVAAHLVYQAGRAALKAIRKPAIAAADRADLKALFAEDWAKRINPRLHYGGGVYGHNDYPIRAASEDSVEDLTTRVKALEAHIQNDKKQPGKKESK